MCKITSKAKLKPIRKGKAEVIVRLMIFMKSDMMELSYPRVKLKTKN